MATNTEIQTFIDTVGTLAQSIANMRTTWVLPSVCIAQGALESGWGTSTKMKKFNAIFGIKANKAWVDAGKKVYSTQTMEYYNGWTTTTALFRAYDSLYDSVNDYYDLITKNSRYSDACNKTDPRETITAIKNGGYATDPNYIENVLALYNTALKRDRDLTSFDSGMGEGITPDPPTPDNPTPEDSETNKTSIYQLLEDTAFNRNGLDSFSRETLKRLTVGSVICIKYSFRKNKKVIGFDRYGKRFKSGSEKYVILSVEKTGLIKVSQLLTESEYDETSYKYVNPYYIVAQNEFSTIDIEGETIPDQTENENPEVPDPPHVPEDPPKDIPIDPVLNSIANIPRANRMSWLFPDGTPTTESQMSKYLITITCVTTTGNKRLTVHKKLADSIKQIFVEMKDIGFPVRNSDTGAYNWRLMSGGSLRSYHSYGTCIDINWQSNPFVTPPNTGTYKPYTDPYSVTPEVVNIWKKYGFYWGGNWNNKKDYMHFTFTNN